MAAITVQQEGTGDIITFDTVAEAGNAAEFISSIEKVWGEGVLLKPSSTSVFTSRTPGPLLQGIYTFRPKSSTTEDRVIVEKLDDIMRLLQLNNDITMDRFMYTEGKVTCKNDPGAKRFSRRVKVAYDALDHGQCWCLLTNDKLPSSTVIASHLFKWEWAECVHLLGLEDVNDTRNGLPLWKPLQWAFDSSRLCFTYNKDSDQFIANVLGPNILTRKMSDVGPHKMGAEWVEPPNRLKHLTFQHIDQQPLKFAPSSLQRPFRRVLNFQARQARKFAIRHNWKPLSWDFEDYHTEGTRGTGCVSKASLVVHVNAGVCIEVYNAKAANELLIKCV